MKRSLFGFTLVEISIVAALSVIILLFVQQFFFSGVRSTIKGQDTLESIRAASLLFSQIHKDLMACQSVDTNNASVTLAISGCVIPSGVNFSDTLSFCTRNATTTYSLISTPQGKHVLRTYKPISGSIETKTFGIPRMESFEALQIWKIHRIGANSIKTGQILVKIIIDSKDPRIPTKRLSLASIFVSQQLSSSDWNYFYY